MGAEPQLSAPGAESVVAPGSEKAAGESSAASITAKLKSGPSIASVLRSLGPPPWAPRINALNQIQLFNEFPREAQIQRDLIVSGAPVPSSWRQFRQFLYDVGPAPIEGGPYILAMIEGAGRLYERGKVRWASPSEPDVFYWRKAEDSSQGGWNRAPPTPRTAQDSIADLLGEMPALQDDPANEAIVNEWLPDDPEKRAVFHESFQLWRSILPPRNRRKARPAFLFLYITLEVMKEARDELAAAGLWSDTPDTQSDCFNHPAWKRYMDQLGRAQTALAFLPEFGGYSLFSQLDVLYEQVVRYEQQMRRA
jgi:hypothetical protein